MFSVNLIEFIEIKENRKEPSCTTVPENRKVGLIDEQRGNETVLQNYNRIINALRLQDVSFH